MSLIRDTYIRFQVLVHEVAKFGVVGSIGFVVQLGVQNALYPGHGVGAVTAVVIAYAVATARHVRREQALGVQAPQGRWP